MIRHGELAQDGIPYLMPVPNRLTIYKQYYLKHLGVWLNILERWVAIDGKGLWASWLNDPELKKYPHEALGNFAKVFFKPIAKQKATLFIKMVIVPALLALLVLGYLLRLLCKRCCCAEKVQ
mmetsp:Transcript_14501/g.17326  ORF Transcript_14501/g.17326 Transcript_14501/m.17326 type:complete len:122 (+) Transcript_14501:327-692(+)